MVYRHFVTAMQEKNDFITNTFNNVLSSLLELINKRNKQINI